MINLIGFIGKKSLYPIIFSAFVGFCLAGVEIFLASYFIYLLSLINLSQGQYNLIDGYLHSIDNQFIVLAGFVGLSLIRAMLHVIKGYLAVSANELFVARLRFLCVNSVITDTEAKFNSSSIYSLISDVFLKSAFTFYGIAHSVPLIVQCFFLLVFLFMTSVYLSAIGIVAMFLSGLFVLIIQKKISNLVSPIKHINDDLYRNLKRVLENIILIRLFKIENAEIKKTKALLQDYLNRIKSSALLSLIVENLPQVFGAVIIAILFHIQINNGEINAEVFVAFAYIFVRFIQNLSQVFSFLSNSIINLPYFKASYDFYQTLPTGILKDLSPDPSQETKTFATDSHGNTRLRSKVIEHLAPDIQFKGVTHDYIRLASDKHNISLSIKSGERCVIVGPSGSGKSTVLSMLAGMLAPQSGRIQISGMCPKEYIAEHAVQTSYAGPEPLLFEGTLKENLLYGVDRPVTDQELIKVMVCLGLDDWLHNFHYDLCRKLGGDDLATSTGQAQRISLSRAILREPKLLLLDEVTANLDRETEQKFISLLDAMKGKTTVVVITHSDGMTRNADRILDLAQ